MIFYVHKTTDMLDAKLSRPIEFVDLESFVAFIREYGGAWNSGRSRECVVEVEQTSDGERLYLEIYDSYRE